jgi:hypothetical protein
LYRKPAFRLIISGGVMSKSKKIHDMTMVHPNATGIDIGSQFHVATIPPDRV